MLGLELNADKTEIFALNTGRRLTYDTVHLVDFCTCAADCYALFPFLCQSYVTVLKQLSFKLKNYVFFSCNPRILKGCCLFFGGQNF
jgi:hypothetical protein